MHKTFRTTLKRIEARHRHVVRTSILLAGLLWAPPGCKKSSDPQPQATPETQPAETRSPNVTVGDAKPAPKPLPSDTATTQPATVRSDSRFFPSEEVVKIELDNVVLSRESAYESLMPALVRFLDSAAETDFPHGTPVMRPAIHLNTATGRISYMLVPGEPAVRVYMPDRSNPWLYGDDKVYEQLITELERLYGRNLPRE